MGCPCGSQATPAREAVALEHPRQVEEPELKRQEEAGVQQGGQTQERGCWALEESRPRAGEGRGCALEFGELLLLSVSLRFPRGTPVTLTWRGATPPLPPLLADAGNHPVSERQVGERPPSRLVMSVVCAQGVGDHMGAPVPGLPVCVQGPARGPVPTVAMFAGGAGQWAAAVNAARNRWDQLPLPSCLPKWALVSGSRVQPSAAVAWGPPGQVVAGFHSPRAGAGCEASRFFQVTRLSRQSGCTGGDIGLF